MEKTKNTHAADIEKYKIIRDRWDKEDTLLISRTGIFLTTNSILLAVAGFQAKNSNSSPFFQIGVAVMGLILSCLWLTTSWHSYKIIRALFELCQGCMPYGLRAIHDIRPVVFRHNTVFCKIIPALIIVGWLAYIAWTAIQIPQT